MKRALLVLLTCAHGLYGMLGRDKLAVSIGARAIVNSSCARVGCCWVGGDRYSKDIIGHIRSSLTNKYAQQIDAYIGHPADYDKGSGSPLMSYIQWISFNIGNLIKCGGRKDACCLIKFASEYKNKSHQYIQNNPDHPITKECIDVLYKKFLTHWYTQEKEFCHRDILPDTDGYKDVKNVVNQEREKCVEYQEKIYGYLPRL